MASKEKMGAVLFTYLCDLSAPCSVDDICQNVKGLRRKRSDVQELLDYFCSTGSVTHINNQYILTEKLITPVPREEQHLTSATNTSRSYNEGQSPRNSGNGRAVDGAVAIRNPNTAVAVQQNVNHRSQTTVATCDGPTVQLYTDHLRKITDLLKQNQGQPMKAKDIAQRTGIGVSKSTVNRFLYCLEKNGIVKNEGSSQWRLIREVKGDDLMLCSAQLAKTSSGASTATPPSQGQAPMECDCPNAGPTCTHVNIQQVSHHYHYNAMVGDNNTMYTPGSAKGQDALSKPK